jgi:hypothetical protein
MKFRTLRLATVAEWVAIKKQLDRLRSHLMENA